MRDFESCFAELRNSRSFRDEYERYFKETRAKGEKPSDPKSWALERLQAADAEKDRARVARREAKEVRRRAREVTSAIVRYEDYPT